MGRNLERWLRQGIFSNRLRGGDRLLSELQLMRRYHLTRYQVRKSLRKLELEGLLKRSRGSGTYVVPLEDRPVRHSPKQKRTFQILFLYFLNSITEALFHTEALFDPIFSGLSNTLNRAGCKILMSKVGNDMKCPELLMQGKFDGIIFWGAPSPKFYRTYMLKRPCIGINSYAPEFDCAFVEEDYFSMGFQAVDCLYSMGHRNIGYFSDCAQLHQVPDHLRGYLAAMERYHLPVHPNSIVNFQQEQFDRCTSPWPEMPDYSLQLAPILNVHPSVTAIVCIDDARAVVIQNALKKRNIRMPEDISLVGSYSNSQLMGEYTSLGGCLEQICSIAASQIIDALERKVVIAGKTTLVRPHLTIGNSVKRLRNVKNIVPLPMKNR